MKTNSERRRQHQVRTGARLRDLAVDATADDVKAGAVNPFPSFGDIKGESDDSAQAKGWIEVMTYSSPVYR